MNTRTIIRYSLLVLLVVMLGALAGWYFFLHSSSAATQATDAARGFSTGTTPGSVFGQSPSGPGANTSATSSTQEPPQMWRVSAAPAAGIGFATSTQGERVRYAERATGYIFDADPQTGGLTRLSNMLMPKTYQASFASGGRVIERSVDSTGAITTFAGNIIAGTSTSLTGVSLAKNLLAVAPSGKSGGIVYLAPSGSGVSVVSAGWDGSKSTVLYSSPLSGWRLWALDDGRTLIAQKAADGFTGYAYSVQNGSLAALTPALPGLTVLPRSGSGAIIFGASSGGTPVLFTQLSASSSAVRLPIATVADKCLWAPGTLPVAYCAVPQTAPSGNFLDAWYRGEVHTSDVWWRVDASTGQAQLIFTPPSNMPVDVINPVMDPGGEYIAFLNNDDLTPWVLRLNK